MKKITATLLGIIMIFSMSINIQASEKDASTSIVLSEQSYSGSKADFNIIISQEKSADDSVRRQSTDRYTKRLIGNSASFEKTNLGITGNITLFDQVDELTIQFTENSDDQIEIEDDNSLVFYDGQGEMIGAAGILNIKDANGESVDIQVNVTQNAVHYEIIDVSVVYPLTGEIVVFGVNDFSQWFSSGKWMDRGGDISLSLTHTGWAYAGVPTSQISWSWNTVKTKFSSSSNWYNESGLNDQYWCHVNFAADKGDWNLEAWRPYVGYTATINAQCNP